MLCGRTTTINLNGWFNRTFSIKAGVPQGGSLSSILFVLYNAELVEMCRTSSLAFVDDLNILVYSSSTAENGRRLERAHEKCQEWARRHGAKFSPEKYELIHFTRSRRTDLHEAVRVEGETCPPKAEVRVLGVQVDPKLLWCPHINRIKKKVTGQMRKESDGLENIRFTGILI
jgi:hypothetical protein